MKIKDLEHAEKMMTEHYLLNDDEFSELCNYLRKEHDWDNEDIYFAMYRAGGKACTD